MVQVVFLDTNVILDYLENRDEAVKDIVERLLDRHKNGRVVLATSVFNIAESIDKEFDIHFGKWGLTQKLAFDEIQKLRRDWRKFAEVSGNHRHRVRKNIEAFAVKNELVIYSVPPESEQYDQLYELIYKYQLESQDALIVAAALANNTTYFLSNDSELIAKTRDILDGYNLRDEGLRKSFVNNVLEAI
jgi:predicted nucleic acid-binding protein